MKPLPIDKVLHNAPLAYALIDQRNQFSYVNKSFAKRISNVPLSQNVQSHVRDIIGHRRWESMKPLVKRAFKGETIKNGLIIGIGEGTPSNWYLVSYYPVHQEKTVTYVGLILEEITYQKYVEEEWRRAKEELEIILNHTTSGIIVYDHDKQIILLNETMKQMYQLHGFAKQRKKLIHRDEFIAHITERFTFVDDKNKEFDPHTLPGISVYKGQKEPEHVYKCTHKKTNKYAWHHMKGRPIYDQDKQLDMVIVIVHDITIQKDIDKRKDDFISAASHELKTPITTLHALIQLIQSRVQKQQYDTIPEYIGKMNHQIHRQIDLIDNLLDVSRIQSGKITYRFSDIMIDSFIRDVVSEFQLNYPEHTIEVTGKTSSYVKADKYRITQVIHNLLTNAVKYAPESRVIQVAVHNKNSMVTVSVQDYGKGIPQEKIESIFEHFYQIDEKSRSLSGLGLGLYISYEIMKKHHGRLWVESTVGKGSTFFISLPKKTSKK